MRPALVVELSPAFDEYFGLGAAAEPVAVQSFVEQLAVEAFHELVSRWTSRRDYGRVDCSISRASATSNPVTSTPFLAYFF